MERVSQPENAVPSDLLPQTPLTLLRESAGPDPAADLDRHLELLRAVGTGASGPLLRLYVPSPTLSFGRRDTRREGFDVARRAAADQGFQPVVRSAGGRATAYHGGTLIVDHIQPAPEPMLTHQQRFRVFGDLFARALRAVGVDAHVGEVPGEYCPGEFSVHGVAQDGARVKLVGTAQRVVAGAWLFSSVVVVADAAPLRQVTEDVYRALGLELGPATVGSVQDLLAHNGQRPRPGLEDVAGALLSTWEEAGFRLG